MRRGGMVLAAGVSLLVAVGCGSGDETATSSASEQHAATASQLSTAYGKLVGECLASEFIGGPEFKERQKMRRRLHLIAETTKVVPNRKTEGLTAAEILFDLIPILKGCDQSMALEAEVAVGK